MSANPVTAQDSKPRAVQFAATPSTPVSYISLEHNFSVLFDILKIVLFVQVTNKILSSWLSNKQGKFCF